MSENRHTQTDSSERGHHVRPTLRPLWALAFGGLGLFVAHVGLGLLADQRAAFEVLYVGLLLLAAALCIVEGLLLTRERAAWILLGLGIASFAAGSAHYLLVLEGLANPTYPSLSDAFWLAFYPLSLIALMLLVRARVAAARGISWLDALIAALTLAAIAAALLVPLILESIGGGLGAVITSLAYPLSDALVLGLVLRVLVLSGGRPGRTFLIIGAAFAIQVVADTVYLYQAASGSYGFGTLLDAGWLTVALLLAYAARQLPERSEAVKSEDWSVVLVPTLAALAALAITTWDSFHGVHDVAVVLATVVLVLAFLRTATLFAELRSHARTSELLARHDSILESAGEGICGLDCDGRTIFANEAAATLTGFSVDELLTHGTHYLLHHSRADGTQYPISECPVHDSLRTGRAHEVFDEVYFRKDGTSFPVEYTSTPIRENGEVKGAVVVFKDISERRRAEQERAELERRLQQSQRLDSVGQLAGGIAHDFNNLLAVILNYASFAREGLSAGDPVRDDVDEIHGAAERAAALTRQLLTFSRRDVIEPELLDLNAVVKDLEKLLRRTLGEDVALETSLAADLPPVKADRSQIEQVVLNLAVNARDAMPDGGTLTIETRSLPCNTQSGARGERRLSLTVRDTGCGMAAEVAAQAFEPFYTTKPREEGSGLGLATVYGIVAASGGTIDLRSEPGRGTVVEVALPAAEDRTPPSPAAKPAAAPLAGKETTILLVEDELAVRELTRRILVRHGHEVLVASSPKEALRVVANHEWPLGLLLTDVVMPDMSGRELAERLLETQPNLRVLYMSGYDDEIVSRHRVVEAGAPLIQKPFDVASLLGGVERALEAKDPTDGARLPI